MPVRPRLQRPCAGPAVIASVLALCAPRPSARAEDSLAYAFENYREDDGRITVETQTSTVNQDIGADGHIMMGGTIDAVSGATPTGRPAAPGGGQVPLTEIHTRRKAWDGDFSEQYNNITIDAGFAESRESDYVSFGWSVNALADFNQKNTTLRAGIAGTDDRVEVFFEPAYLPKHTHDAIAGITQILDPLTFVTLNVSAGASNGYLAEPHKFVEKSVEILPNIFLDEAFGENSPNERNRESVFASVNRAVPKLRAAAELSYRFYADSYGIVAHTVELSWSQHVGGALILEPTARLYQQTAARFYYYNLDTTPIVPVQIPMGEGPYYTSDFRLSAERDATIGLKAIWKPSAWLQLIASYDRFEMRGLDGVTPQSAYPRAGISTAAVKFLW